MSHHREQRNRSWIGTHAITFEQGALYRYELSQLGDLGHRYWQQIVAGVRPEPHLPTGTVMENVQHYNTLLAQIVAAGPDEQCSICQSLKFGASSICQCSERSGSWTQATQSPRLLAAYNAAKQTPF
jgi:hypothetical protein